ncbi:hypothetical protein [Janthinobacterium agaricidamnosum]|uniref:hypothetical protein n=1 Tax=Janthinobacterium agaricidamnosum TaxID=55508 RepID=UPI0013CEF20A|nr:hypothetical protein [Janthinobacterium agaricidamnosum]
MTINNGELIMDSDFAREFWYLFKISEIDGDYGIILDAALAIGWGVPLICTALI